MYETALSEVGQVHLLQENMICRPQEKTAEEILETAGFSYDARASAGWVKYFEEPVVIKRQPGTCVVVKATDLQKKKRNLDRLHALVRDGDIYLHYDAELKGVHKATHNGNTVKRYILKFQKIDYEKEEVPIVA